jgi:lipopolysaccharide export system permease protein
LQFGGKLPTILRLVKTLHRYLTRQIVVSLTMTVLVFTFVLLLGNALKDILQMLVSGQVGLSVVASAAGLLIPFVWVFALPMGMLTATLLIFGRFSADQELTAARAGGISLLSLTSPIFLLSLFLCVVSALLNMEIGPRCRVAYTTLFFNLRAGITSAQLPEGHFIKNFPGYIFFVGKNNRKGDLQDVIVLAVKNETNIDWGVRAARGRVDIDTANRKLNLTLSDVKSLPLGERDTLGSYEEVPLQLDLEPAQRAPQKPKVDDMTFAQLRQELHELEQLSNLPISGTNLTAAQLRARNREWQQQRKDLMAPVLFQIHRQVAYSFACFGFTLVGIPLGIRVHRRETTVGIAVALGLVAVYYSFIYIAQGLQSRPELASYLIVWVPNFLFQAVGSVLLWRANRGV